MGFVIIQQVAQELRIIRETPFSFGMACGGAFLVAWLSIDRIYRSRLRGRDELLADLGDKLLYLLKTNLAISGRAKSIFAAPIEHSLQR